MVRLWRGGVRGSGVGKAQRDFRWVIMSSRIVAEACRGRVLRVTFPSVLSGVAIPLLKLTSVAVTKRLKATSCVNTVTVNDAVFGVVC